MSVPREKLLKMCEDIIAPLIHADGGALFVVSIEADSIALHLPANARDARERASRRPRSSSRRSTRSRRLMRVVVTSGFQIPAGASVRSTRQRRGVSPAAFSLLRDGSALASSVRVGGAGRRRTQMAALRGPCPCKRRPRSGWDRPPGPPLVIAAIDGGRCRPHSSLGLLAP